MFRASTSLAAAALATATVLALASPAGASPAASNPNNAVYWEYSGVYSCTKVNFRDKVRTYTRPSPVAFVVIRTGRETFVSDLGDANEGDSTYTFDKNIKYVITCLFTDA